MRELSHTSTDKDLVKLVQEKSSTANAWYDAVDIENGQSIPEKINEGLRHSTHYVLFGITKPPGADHHVPGGFAVIYNYTTQEKSTLREKKPSSSISVSSSQTSFSQHSYASRS